MKKAMFLSIFFVLTVVPALALATDGQTPSQEVACEKYEGEGARHGLCIAYCEAQDCDITKLSNPSCASIAERFIAYSVKQGYIKNTKIKPSISCAVTMCTKEDKLFCRGMEMDCNTDNDLACEEVCSAKFAGFSSDGKPLCETTKECKKCVGEDPLK